VGTRTDAAEAAVVAARLDLADQVDRLEAAGRAAVDIPAKVKANPAKAAGVAAGGAFLAVGGPKRLFRRAKRAITGEDEELPSELLPKEVEKTLKKLGTDGRAVRGTLEREFARYLDDRQKERKKEGIVAAATGLALTALRPIAMRSGRQIAERMLDPNQPSFNEQLAKVRARRAAGGVTVKPEGAPEDAGL
jgi:hypothetical protein